MTSLWEQHCSKWAGCQGCVLAKTRKRVVLARGNRIPCDIVFIGEAPGESENVLGQPFVGPAGHLLDRIIHRAFEGTVVTDPASIGYTLTNLVCCIPRDDDGSKLAEPSPESIQACRPRLEEFVRLAQPRLIVCVGALAEAWIMEAKGKRHLLQDYEGKLVAIKHPAYILRANVAQRGLLIQRAVVTLTNAVDEIFASPEPA